MDVIFFHDSIAEIIQVTSSINCKYRFMFIRLLCLGVSIASLLNFFKRSPHLAMTRVETDAQRKRPPSDKWDSG